MSQLFDQMQLLAEQAKKINQRKEVSERIYQAKFRFDPIINHVYYLYEDEQQEQILSIIAPQEWGRSRKQNYTYIATIKLLADHTWEVIDASDNSEI